MDTSVFSTTLPVEVTDMIMQRLDAPSVAAARRANVILANVGRRHLRTDDCFNKAMFRTGLSRLIDAVVSGAVSFFASPPPGSARHGIHYFTPLRAGAVLNRYLFRLIPTGTGWVDESGLVTFTRTPDPDASEGSPGLERIAFQAPGQPAVQTGLLQLAGNPELDTYSAWLQQAIHCHIAGKAYAHVVPAVLPFFEHTARGPVPDVTLPVHQPEESSGGWRTSKRLAQVAQGVAPNCRVIEMVTTPAVPLFETLGLQLNTVHGRLFVDEDEEPPAVLQNHGMLTDMGLLSIVGQVVGLLLDLHFHPILHTGIRFVSMNDVVDVLMVAWPTEGGSRTEGGAGPLARISHFQDMCIKLSSDRASIRVAQPWAQDEPFRDIVLLLVTTHFILTGSVTFPRTVEFLTRLHVERMYVGSYTGVVHVGSVSAGQMLRMVTLLQEQLGEQSGLTQFVPLLQQQAQQDGASDDA